MELILIWAAAFTPPKVQCTPEGQKTQKTQKVGSMYEAGVCFVLVTPVHFIGLSERP
jgi:hypothetical protein